MRWIDRLGLTDVIAGLFGSLDGPAPAPRRQDPLHTASPPDPSGERIATLPVTPAERRAKSARRRCSRRSIGRSGIAGFIAYGVLACLALGAGEAGAQIQRSMVNLGFEQPGVGSAGCNIYVRASDVPGWETTAPGATVNFNNGCTINPNTGPTVGNPPIELYRGPFTDSEGSNNPESARAGVQWSELNAEVPSRLYENVCLANGDLIGWKFSHRGRSSNTVADVAEFRIADTSGTNRVVQASTNATGGGSSNCFANDGGVSGNTCTRAAATGGWADYSGAFTWNGAAGVQRIGFEAISSAIGDPARGNFVDEVQITLRPFVELVATTYSVTEGGAFAPPQIRIVGTVPAGGITVLVNLTGTATVGTDYTTASGTAVANIFVPAGTYDGTGASSLFNVPITSIVNDGIVESSETIVMTIAASAGNYVIASTTTCGAAPNTTSTLTILDHVAPLVTCATPPEIFNTAYNGSGGILPVGVRDGNWEVGLGTHTGGPASVATWINAYVTGNQVPGAWADSPFGNADWISYYPDTQQGGASVDLYFRYRFTLDPAVTPSSFRLGIDFYSDNSVWEAYVNGVAQSGSVPGIPQDPANPYLYQAYRTVNRAQLAFPNGWQTGLNTFVIEVSSGVPQAGLMAQTTSSALCPSQLTLTKTATPNPFVIGQPASYALTVQNTGLNPTTGDFTITDTLPAGVSFVSASGANWSCTGTTTLSCTYTGVLAAGAATTLTLNVLVSG